jgi:hypothetical protein
MGQNRFIYLPLCLLILLALACDISINSAPAQPTTDLQATIDAAIAITETAQKNAQVTADVASTPTSQVVSPTATPIPTDSPEAIPSTPPSPAATVPASITITDWGMYSFVPLSSGCKVKNAPCWKADDDFSKHVGNPMVLTSKTPVFIEPSWPSPYLVFWHKYDLKNPASLVLEVDGDWVIVRDFSKSKGDWTQFFFNLSDYKGKEIRVRFMADGQWTSGAIQHGIPSSVWFIQEVQVFPDFTPK